MDEIHDCRLCLADVSSPPSMQSILKSVIETLFQGKIKIEVDEELMVCSYCEYVLHDFNRFYHRSLDNQVKYKKMLQSRLTSISLASTVEAGPNKTVASVEEMDKDDFEEQKFDPLTQRSSPLAVWEKPTDDGFPDDGNDIIELAEVHEVYGDEEEVEEIKPSHLVSQIVYRSESPQVLVGRRKRNEPEQKMYSIEAKLKLLEEFKNSKETPKNFAENRNIAAHTLRNWLRSEKTLKKRIETGILVGRVNGAKSKYKKIKKKKYDLRKSLLRTELETTGHNSQPEDKKSYSNEDKLRLIAQFESSSESIHSFAKKMNVNYTQMYYWMKTKAKIIGRNSQSFGVVINPVQEERKVKLHLLSEYENSMESITDIATKAKIPKNKLKSWIREEEVLYEELEDDLAKWIAKRLAKGKKVEDRDLRWKARYIRDVKVRQLSSSGKEEEAEWYRCFRAKKRWLSRFKKQNNL